jgi:hypothetical protein
MRQLLSQDRGGSMRGLSTRQRGVRIDFAGNGDQREFEDDDRSSHGRFLARECGKISQIPRLKTEVPIQDAPP